MATANSIIIKKESNGNILVTPEGTPYTLLSESILSKEIDSVIVREKDSRSSVSVFTVDAVEKIIRIDGTEVLISDVDTLFTELNDNIFFESTGTVDVNITNADIPVTLADNQVNVNQNELGFDAWGRNKVVKDNSILHGMFTFNVPVKVWKEEFNGVGRVPTNATSLNGKLRLISGSNEGDSTYLRTFRNPRYEPNRGLLYSTAIFLPSPSANGIRRWGYFTAESGAFFELTVFGQLSIVTRTTINGVTTDNKQSIDTTGIDLSKGNIYDIQMQWRGVGNYKFFINNTKVGEFEYLGTLEDLSIYNPANPIAFECTRLTSEVAIECGCVDISSEGGKDNGKAYGSVGISNESGQVSISGFNTPIVAIRSKLTVGGLINTRDTLALLLSSYSDQKSFIRVWSTRDFTKITENSDSWNNFGDGHLEFIEANNGGGTNMEFNTDGLVPIFGSRVGQDTTYSTSALFEGRTEIYLTPGDMFVFTMHRENGGAALVGTTFEFAEAI